MLLLLTFTFSSCLIAMVQCDYPFESFNRYSTTRTKFRPSQQYHDPYEFNYTPSDYIFNYPPRHSQHLQHQQYQTGHFPNQQDYFQRQSQFNNKPLFVPASVPYPAETPGQIDNYNRALLEEAAEQEEEQENNKFVNGFSGYSSSIDNGAKSYVDVKFGPGNLHYQYQFK